MWIITGFFLCSIVVVIAQDEVDFHADMPFMKAHLNEPASVECCYNTKGVNWQVSWTVQVQDDNGTLSLQNITSSKRVVMDTRNENDKFCSTLVFNYVQLNDSGLYQCFLYSGRDRFTSHGTYLHVYKPLEKTIKLTENTKNKILTAEGILLFLCVLMPATTLLFQSKKEHEVERKKVKREEENIYQGLNLDDCCSTYDQIERSQAHGPYQDVCNIAGEEGEFQLEKP